MLSRSKRADERTSSENQQVWAKGFQTTEALQVSVIRTDVYVLINQPTYVFRIKKYLEFFNWSPDSIADSDASAASSDGKWELN